MRIQDLSQQNDALIAKIKTYLRSVWIFYLATNPWLRPGFKRKGDRSSRNRGIITAKLGLRGMAKSKIVDEACETLYDFFPRLDRTGCRTLLMQRMKVSDHDEEMLAYFEGLELVCDEWLNEIDQWNYSSSRDKYDQFNVDAVLALEHRGRLGAMVGFWYRHSSMHGALAKIQKNSQTRKWLRIHGKPTEESYQRSAAFNHAHCSRSPKWHDSSYEPGPLDSWPGGEPDFEMRYIIVHPVFTLARAILRQEPALSSVLAAEYVAGAQLARAAERLAMTFSVGRPCILKVLPFGARWKRTLRKLGFSVVGEEDEDNTEHYVHMKKRVTLVPKVHHEISAYLACPWFGFYTSA